MAEAGGRQAARPLPAQGPGAICVRGDLGVCPAGWRGNSISSGDRGRDEPAPHDQNKVDRIHSTSALAHQGSLLSLQKQTCPARADNGPLTRYAESTPHPKFCRARRFRHATSQLKFDVCHPRLDGQCTSQLNRREANSGLLDAASSERIWPRTGEFTEWPPYRRRARDRHDKTQGTAASSYQSSASR